MLADLLLREWRLRRSAEGIRAVLKDSPTPPQRNGRRARAADKAGDKTKARGYAIF